MSMGKCSRESQINICTNIKEKIVIVQSQEHGFQGKSAYVSAGDGQKKKKLDLVKLVMLEGKVFPSDKVFIFLRQTAPTLPEL